jgi:hypothetical protein
MATKIRYTKEGRRVSFKNRIVLSDARRENDLQNANNSQMRMSEAGC